MLTKIKIYGRLRKFCNNEKSFEASIKKPFILTITTLILKPKKIDWI